MKVFMFFLLIAVIALTVWLAGRMRASQADALRAGDRPNEPAVDAGTTAAVEPVMAAEPDPPAQPEPVIEPDTAAAGPPPGDHPAADPDEPTDPPRAVVDAGETAAKELDPRAGWETEDDTTVHADPESGLYHTPDSPGYKLGPDGQVFESEDDARAAGFTRWDQPG